MIFVLRQVQEKCREHNMGLYAAFVDLTKAFDTVSCDGLWKILACLDCLPNFLTILRQLHEGQQGQVKHNGSLSGSFPISNCVKQGCVLASTLFSIVPEQTTVSSTFGVSYTRKPLRNLSLSCYLLTTAPFSPTWRKPYSTSSTASLLQPRTSASPSI